MENLHKEMQLIEIQIKKLNDSTLQGESREVFNDTFSQVTAQLLAISQDLGQERVNILPNGDGKPGANGNKRKNNRVLEEV